MDWKVSARPVAYGTALDFMEKRVQGIAGGQEAECIWLLEHPPLYTAGTSADAADLVDPDRFPVHRSGRGGQYTYHGPGQRVAYVMLDLNRRRRDIRLFVEELEHWIIDTLARGNIHGERRDERVGIWVRHERDGLAREDKIAAIGVRVRKWVTFHGISLNISPDLGHFSGIVPCGIPQYGVTSYADLGLEITMSEVDTVLRQAFDRRFGRTTTQDGHPA